MTPVLSALAGETFMPQARDGNPYPPVGLLLREWRAARRMSQLDMALECGMSARHLGFVETGKARPSRDAIGRFADALTLPLRRAQRAAPRRGLRTALCRGDLTTPALERMRDAVDLIPQHQNPYPAFILNRHFDVLGANDGAANINRFVMEGRESRHANLLRQIFDPDDFRPVILNWRQVATGFPAAAARSSRDHAGR